MAISSGKKNIKMRIRFGLDCLRRDKATSFVYYPRKVIALVGRWPIIEWRAGNYFTSCLSTKWHDSPQSSQARFLLWSYLWFCLLFLPFFLVVFLLCAFLFDVRYDTTIVVSHPTEDAWHKRAMFSLILETKNTITVMPHWITYSLHLEPES